MFAFLQKLSGYRTYICVGLSLIFKLLYAANAIPALVSDEDVARIADALLLALSGIGDLGAIFSRLFASKPGALARPVEPEV